MKGRGCLTALLIVAILGYFAYRIIVPTYNWRQKISVVVETPNGEISAYSVQHIIAQKGPGVPNQGSNTAIDLKAEAVVIQLNESDYLFALINNSASLVPYLAAPRKGVRSHEGLGAADSLPVGTTFTLTGGTFPLLVTFDDITKPETVKRVLPGGLEDVFGPGYRLKSITLEITDEPITTGKVEEVLGWLSQNPEPKLGPATGQTDNIPFYRRVSHGDFIRR